MVSKLHTCWKYLFPGRIDLTLDEILNPPDIILTAPETPPYIVEVEDISNDDGGGTSPLSPSPPPSVLNEPEEPPKVPQPKPKLRHRKRSTKKAKEVLGDDGPVQSSPASIFQKGGASGDFTPPSGHKGPKARSLRQRKMILLKRITMQDH